MGGTAGGVSLDYTSGNGSPEERTAAREDGVNEHSLKSWSDVCCFAPSSMGVDVHANDSTTPPLPAQPPPDARTVSRVDEEDERAKVEITAAPSPPQLQEREPQRELAPKAAPPVSAAETTHYDDVDPLPRLAPTRQSGVESNGMLSAQVAPTSSRLLKGLTAVLTPRDRRQHKSGNTNLPTDYRWLEGTLQTLSRNEGGSLDCRDLQTGKQFFPLFFCLGGCPNMWCGMQVVMYCVSLDGVVDFWWVKPNAQDGIDVEHNTLNRHAKGPHKNDPGRSKQFLKPLADFFQNKERLPDGTTFGVERLSTHECMRAFIERPLPGGQSTKYYLDLVWQEDWSTPFSRTSFIKGKLVYQQESDSQSFYARQYQVVNNKMILDDREEYSPEGVLPGDFIKDIG